ncbi:MAG: tetratricopeptide repeat protein [Nitrospinota bacterium]
MGRTEAEELFAQGWERHRRGDLERAIELYRESIETFPLAEAHTFLGWAYSHQGDVDRAIEECFKAIDADPDYGNPYNDIGAYYIQKEMYDEAVPWLEKALRAKRYECRHYPHMNLGRVYLHKRKYAEAIRAFEKALEIEPEYQLARVQLSKLRAMFN